MSEEFNKLLIDNINGMRQDVRDIHAKLDSNIKGLDNKIDSHKKEVDRKVNGLLQLKWKAEGMRLTVVVIISVVSFLATLYFKGG